MKNRKKLLVIAIFLCSLLIWTPAMADGNDADVIVSLQIDNPMMQVNGVQSEIDAGRGTTPVVMDDRTLVPIRAIIEAFAGTVDWDEAAQAAILQMDGDTIYLVTGSTAAYLNDRMYTLDVAPCVINDRTMLPIRFIAEGFNLGVAWDDRTQTVTVIKNSFDCYEYEDLMAILPAYSGSPYVELNQNIPYFKDYERITGSFEYYSKLDEAGRCDVCMASIAADIMPTEERESISSVTPTGWQSVTYDAVEGKYLYNRCHLIGFQLTGENANEKNLITGTRYMYVDRMLPFETMVADYVEATGNHVMYRATPVFDGDNLVARGVLLEGYSIEDEGMGICFCVYCYNVQPSITIDYATGASSGEGIGEESTNTDATTAAPVAGGAVYRTPFGKRYHLDPDCGGKNSYAVTLEQANAAGLTPCQKCAQ